MQSIYDKDLEVYVVFDPRPPQVIVPAKYKSTSTKHMVLTYGSSAVMVKPIIDLQICSDGISATLSFSGENFLTFVPWSAVFGIYDKDQTLGSNWEEDVPPDFRQAANQ